MATATPSRSIPSKAELAYTPGPGYKPSPPPLPTVAIPEDLYPPPPPRTQTSPTADAPSHQYPFHNSSVTLSSPVRQQTVPVNMGSSHGLNNSSPSLARGQQTAPAPVNVYASGAPAPYQAAYQPRSGSMDMRVLPPPPIPEQERRESADREQRVPMPQAEGEKSDTENGTKDDMVELGFELIKGISRAL